MSNYREELVKEVREGRLAIHYKDCTLEELQKLVKYCFLDDTWIARGINPYYQKYKDSKNLWQSRGYTSLPSKSVKEFYMKEQTKYTKEDWINGKVVLEWENDKAEKINKFFKECNLHNMKAIGNARFYYSYTKNGIYHGTERTDLPIVKIDDIVMEEKEQFPKDDFGVIVENGNGKEIIDYLISKGFYSNNCIGAGSNKGHYIIRTNSGDINYSDSMSKNPTSKTYTLEQLKQLDSNNMEKKIIGYRLIKPEYSQAAERIANCSNWAAFETNLLYYNWCKDTKEKLEKAGVLDIWFTPVYEPEKPKEKTITLSNNKLVKVTKEGVRVESKFVEIKYIESLFSNTKMFGDTGWELQINNFDIGCYKNLNREDLKYILEAYKLVN